MLRPVLAAALSLAEAPNLMGKLAFRQDRPVEALLLRGRLPAGWEEY